MRNILLFLAGLILFSCGRHNQMQSDEMAVDSANRTSLLVHADVNSIYHWKTTYDPNVTEREFLKTHRVKRMYIRFFDVALDNGWLQNELSVIPIATTVFKQTPPADMEIVPTVYITLDALRCMQGKEPEYADKVITRVLAIAECHAIKPIREIQLDCDWTKSTQESYFKICEIARDSLHKRGLILSVTIRLHQLKDCCPPVDRGVLMLYNTGLLKNAETENSILTYNDVEPYLKNSQYALPLDFAYPTFAWGVWFRDGKFMAILRQTDFSDGAVYRENKNGTFRVLKDHYLEAHQLLRGDVIRMENSMFRNIKRVKQLVENSLKQPTHSVILYHLDSANLSKYTTDEIETIYYCR